MFSVTITSNTIPKNIQIFWVGFHFGILYSAQFNILGVVFTVGATVPRCNFSFQKVAVIWPETIYIGERLMESSPTIVPNGDTYFETLQTICLPRWDQVLA